MDRAAFVYTLLCKPSAPHVLYMYIRFKTRCAIKSLNQKLKQEKHLQIYLLFFGPEKGGEGKRREDVLFEENCQHYRMWQR